MDDIKIGDIVEIPIVNGTGEVAFIGETHFSKGLWYGIILYVTEGRCDGSVDGIRYFKCSKNRGIFVKSGLVERECVDTSDDRNKQHKSPSNITKYLNYLKANFDVEEFYSNASGSREVCKMKPQKEDYIVQDSYNKRVTNTNGHKHMPGIEIEKEDRSRNDAAYVVHSSSNNRVKYPNYLKDNFNVNASYLVEASAKRGSCEMQPKKDYNVLNKTTRSNNERKCVLQKTKEDLNKNDASYALHSASSNNRIKYPNYLKASSKISWNHICEAKPVDPNKTKHESKHGDRETCSSKSNKTSCSKSLELDTIKTEIEELKGKLKMTEESQQKILGKFEKTEKEIIDLRKEISCGRKKINYQEYQSERSDHEIFSNESNKTYCSKSLELDSIKTEIEELKGRLKMVEESQEEISCKFGEKEKENMFLRKKMSSKRKQQEYQLKLLEMGHLNLYKINNSFVNISDGLFSSSADNFGLKSLKAMISRQEAELQVQNEKTLQRLFEIREFLSDKCKSPVRDSGFLSPSNRFPLKVKKQGF